MQFETDYGAIGTTVISQISAGRKNRLFLELDAAEEALAFYQEEPDRCGSVAARRRLSDQARPRAPLGGGAALRGRFRPVMSRSLAALTKPLMCVAAPPAAEPGLGVLRR